MNKIKKYILKIITLLMWIGFIYNIRYMNKELIVKSLIIALVCFIIMVLWKEYNIKRFGSLRRRKFPVDTTINDLVEFFKISEDRIKKMQESKIIVVKENLF